MFTNFINMKQTLLFIMVTNTIYSSVMSARSQANYGHFVMNETHIREYRSKEDSNFGYPAIFMECEGYDEDNDTRSSCTLAHPILHEKEGHAIFVPEYRIYYGCFYKMNSREVLNDRILKKELLLRRAHRNIFPGSSLNRPPSWFLPYLNYYKYTCTSEISPILWRKENSPEGFYSIGFKFINHNEVVLATIKFDRLKKIPLRTQHFVIGKSLGVPIGAPNTREEIIYEDSTLYRAECLMKAFKSYYKSNGEKSAYIPVSGTLLKSSENNSRPGESEISMAHLIPEYDMVQPVLRKVAYFAQTIAPMWTELYLGVWADVEEMIREIAFQNQQSLTIYTGTQGQLTFKRAAPKNNSFFLDENGVAVPELIWKLVLNTTLNRNRNQQAVVIILHNVTEDLKKSDIFTQLEPPCESKCSSFQWNNIDKENIYCCAVQEVIYHIEELPQSFKDGNFDVLFYDVEG